MTTLVKKINFPALDPQQSTDAMQTDYLSLLANITVECQVRIGSLKLTIAELKQLTKGKVLNLIQKTDEPVELLLNNEVFARGELMSCDDYFAVQIIEVGK
ncbi:flagellar motor switch protein FliN [Legionella birminghamensis]|uniref:Flagellar motor switch protein FliN n=1 Tax=Legionella birminghamensis TaxID=28083 RepID=A0A378IFH3_9GAMM|nr:FliM/FliN family flagellar motor switch protein [Legionella birminghamensis]KTC68313.1 flagellar motor switch protein FliN [Legionella birminghamensis]STX30974.1 flagellar motor switch protein FliN [Legionella birminghamensis]